jgi:hypothetical protein
LRGENLKIIIFFFEICPNTKQSILFIFVQILTPSTLHPQAQVEQYESQTMTITLSITIPSLVSVIVFLFVFIIRRRQVARRDIERVNEPRGNVMLLQNLSHRFEELNEISGLESPEDTPRVLRSSTRKETRNTIL